LLKPLLQKSRIKEPATNADLGCFAQLPPGGGVITMATSHSRVDVVIPCYNYGHYLTECVSSVLSQEGVDVRVLVIDDTSTDNSAEIAAEIARRDHRVDFIRHPVNKGHIRTYNEGIEWTTGEYWLQLSADDVVAPGAFHRATSVMNRYPNVGLAYGRALMAPAAESFPTLAGSNEFLLITGRDFLQHTCETGRNPVPTPTAIVRTALQKQIGGYLPELPHSGDLEMWMRIAVYADVCVLKACQALYRWHGHNMQHHYLQPVIGDLPECARAFDTLFANHGRHVQDAAPLHQTACRTLAEDAIRRGNGAFERGDTRAAAACLDFAAACHPEMASSASWKRLKAKALIGARVWPWVAPLYHFVRGTHRIPGARPPAPRTNAIQDPTSVHLWGTWPPTGLTQQLELT
jgi:hypothetical protein